MQASQDEIKVYAAGAVGDAAGVRASPGAVAMRSGKVVAAGAEPDVLRQVGRGVQRVDVGRNWLMLPGLVNAHVHLDLTGVGYRPYGGDFIGWIKMVMAERRSPGFSTETAVKLGADQSLKAGVLTAGDIAGSVTAIKTRMFAPSTQRLRGVSYYEYFGFDDDLVAAFMEMEDGLFAAGKTNAVKLGLQPHAPYSVGPLGYQFAAKLHHEDGMQISTHLAETCEEIVFVAWAEGPFRKLLESIAKWKSHHEKYYKNGRHPVDWLFGEVFNGRAWGMMFEDSTGTFAVDDPPGRWLLAHCNYVGDEQIARLAKFDASVVYCPRASEYFGHTNHSYRDMIEAGINVCLGTDSIICHGSLSILDEMRRLYQRDRTDPQLLLKMATVNGMRGLQMDEKDATFAPGAAAGLIAIRYDDLSGADPLEQVLSCKNSPEIRVIEMPG